jgi:hypothetical protein
MQQTMPLRLDIPEIESENPKLEILAIAAAEVYHHTSEHPFPTIGTMA